MISRFYFQPKHSEFIVYEAGNVRRQLHSCRCARSRVSRRPTNRSIATPRAHFTPTRPWRWNITRPSFRTQSDEPHWPRPGAGTGSPEEPGRARYGDRAALHAGAAIVAHGAPTADARASAQVRTATPRPATPRKVQSPHGTARHRHRHRHRHRRTGPDAPARGPPRPTASHRPCPARRCGERTADGTGGPGPTRRIAGHFPPPGPTQPPDGERHFPRPTGTRTTRTPRRLIHHQGMDRKETLQRTSGFPERGRSGATDRNMPGIPIRRAIRAGSGHRRPVSFRIHGIAPSNSSRRPHTIRTACPVPRIATGVRAPGPHPPGAEAERTTHRLVTAGRSYATLRASRSRRSSAVAARPRSPTSARASVRWTSSGTAATWRAPSGAEAALS